MSRSPCAWRARFSPPPPDWLLKWFRRTRTFLLLGSRQRYSAQSRLKRRSPGAPGSGTSTLLCIETISTSLLGHDPDVDAPRVVAVDQHHVLEVAAEQVLVEAAQRGPVLDLDDALDVGVDVEDHLRGHVRRDLVDGLLGELEPARPVEAAVGDDLDPGVLVLDVERSPIRPQPDPLRIGMRLRRTTPLSSRYTSSSRRSSFIRSLLAWV